MEGHKLWQHRPGSQEQAAKLHHRACQGLQRHHGSCHGAGVLHGIGQPSITGCTFRNATATRAIHVDTSSPQILNNTFSGFSDCAIYMVDTTATVTGNQFLDNAVGVHIDYTTYANRPSTATRIAAVQRLISESTAVVYMASQRSGTNPPAPSTESRGAYQSQVAIDSRLPMGLSSS